MRALFLALLLANLALVAWWRYLSPADTGLDRAPLARQIEPDKLKIVPAAELTRQAAAKKAPPPGPAGAAPSPAPAAPASGAAPLAPVLACVEWGSFTIADAPRVEKALAPLGLGERLTQRRTEERAGWWVFMPSQGSRQAALRKAAELKNLGVEEFFVLGEEGPYRWALSLGVFRNEDAAQARLAALRAQGVRSARVGPREMVVPKVWLQIRPADALLQMQLKDLARGIEGSELRECAG